MAKAPQYLQKSMAYMRKLGYFCEKTEQKVGNPKQRFLTSRDLFGFMDALAFSPSTKEIVGVQATSAKAIPAHKKKYRENPETTFIMSEWLDAGGLIEMHGWKKVGNRWLVDLYTAHFNGEEIVWLKEGADLS